MSKYNLTTDVRGDAGSTPFKAGINEPCELTDVSYRNTKADGTGQDCLTFEFTNPSGGVFRFIAWPVNEERVRANAVTYKKVHSRDDKVRGYVKGQTITSDQAVDKAYDEFFSRVKHIMTKFIPENETNIQAGSYEDFTRQVVAKLQNKTKGIDLRIKVVYRGKYLNFPRFGNCVELVSTVPSKLTITQYDELNPPATPDAEDAALASASIAAEEGNDLPF